MTETDMYQRLMSPVDSPEFRSAMAELAELAAFVNGYQMDDSEDE